MYSLLLKHFTQIALTIAFVISNSGIYAHSFWDLEEDAQGHTRRVITNYHAENPTEMRHLRNLVRYFDTFEIPDTTQTPPEWLRFRHGPHEQLRNALADEATPAVLLNAYIQSYRKGLKEFLDVVETEEERTEGAEGSGSADIAAATSAVVSGEVVQPILSSEEEGEKKEESAAASHSSSASDVGSQTNSATDDFVVRISGIVGKYMTRLKDRLPRETERLGEQATALVQRLEKKVPVETERALKKIEKEGNRLLGQLFGGRKR